MDIKDLVLSDAAVDVIEKGEWIPAGSGAPGVEFLVTGWQAKAASLLLQEKIVRARKAEGGKPLTEERQSELTKEVLAEAVLKDWKGLEDGGKNLPYSKELATKLLLSRGGDKLASLVLTAAQTLDATANTYVEEVTKN